MHEPVFLKEDVYPFKLYDFEGRKYYSYNNIEKILKEWYGPNCLKKWNGKEWVETLPIEKRKPKHCKDINLNGDSPLNPRPNYAIGYTMAGLLIIISLLIFCEFSFIVMGWSMIIMGATLLLSINSK